MFAKSIAVAAAVLWSGLGWVWAATLDPNRPLGPQPEVTGEVRNYFSGKKIQDLKFYVLGDVIIRVANVGKIKEKIKTDGPNARGDFRETFDPAGTPPAGVSENARMVISYFPKELKRRQAGVADGPCPDCISVRVEYSEQILTKEGWFVEKGDVFQARIAASLFLGEVEIARTRGDFFTQLDPPSFFYKNRSVWAQFFARQAVSEVMYVLHKRFEVQVPPEPPPQPKK